MSIETTDPADLLDRAADRLDALLDALPDPFRHGPWRRVGDDDERQQVVPSDNPAWFVVASSYQSDYIAAMDPIVGRAIVEILRDTAVGCRYEGWPGGEPLLRAARAILGETEVMTGEH